MLGSTADTTVVARPATTGPGAVSSVQLASMAGGGAEGWSGPSTRFHDAGAADPALPPERHDVLVADAHLDDAVLDLREGAGLVQRPAVAP